MERENYMRSPKYIIVFAVLIVASTISAQIPNGDFEQWTNNDPDGWWVNNILAQPTVTRSSDAYSGTYAAKGEVISSNTGILQPLLLSGQIGAHGIPVSERYSNFVGYYKLIQVSNENLSVLVAMFKNGQGIGVGGNQFYGATSYTEFTVPISYITSDIPDSCQISFTIGNNNGPINSGTVFYIDAISFQGTQTSVDEATVTTSFKLDQNFPNPFNPTTIIKYSIPKISSVSLKIYDILGNEVETLVDKELPAGNYEATFNAANLSSGIYFYHLQAEAFSETKKMLFLK